MTSPVIAVLRLLAYLLWSVVAVPPYLLLLATGWRRYPAYCSAYWRVAIRLLGIRVVVHGTPTRAHPALFVANHASYLDILVLGSVLPAVFVAKAEVAGWPLFGFLARIARTAFIERSKGATARERDQLQRRIDEGVQLILFAEGTSSDGNRVLPFKSSFLAIAERNVPGGGPLPVQPVSVAYTRLDGLPLCRAFRPYFAWYGDMTLAAHLLRALGLGCLTVELVFHEPVTVERFGSRKGLTSHCHDVIQHGMTRALAGRLG